MSGPKIEVYISMLEKAGKETLSVAASIAEADRFKQLRPGKATPTWLLGHLAVSMNGLVLRYLLGKDSLISREQSMPFAPGFLGGPPITADPAAYPAWDELTALYAKVLEETLAGIRSLADDILPAPVPETVPERLRERFPTGEALLNQLVSHDAYHRGQMAMIAKLEQS